MIRPRMYIGLAVLAIAALIGAGRMAHALQRPAGPGFGTGGGPGLPRIQQLARQLDLTEAQRTQIRSILENARNQLQALRQDMNITRAQALERRRQIAEETRNQIRSVLTPEQQAKADELRRQAEQRMAARQQEMQERLLARLVRQLDLTESQRSLIQSYQREQQAQLEALRNDSSLTPAQKLERAREIRRHTQEKIRAALTAEQQARLDALRSERQERLRRRDFRRMSPRGFGFGGPGLDL